MRPHRRYKQSERGRKEVPVKVGKTTRRLDAATKTTAVEIERSGRFRLATQRLLKSRRRHKMLRVPKSKIPTAREVVQDVLNRSKARSPRVTITSFTKKSSTTVRKRR